MTVIDERKIGSTKPLGQRSVPSKNTRVLPEIDALAADILAYLAGRPEDLHRFFELTGLTPQSLRGAAGKPSFATSILDYLCSDDRLLLAFATESGHDPAQIDALRRTLDASSHGEP